MAIDMFLYIEGVDGDSKDAQHKGWIDVLAWSFGMSNSVSSGQVPTKARARKAAEKKRLLAEAGFDEHENPLEGNETEKLSRQEQQLKIEEALLNYDPDEGLEFDDSEIVPQKGRANMQDLSLTKYMGLSTAQLFAMCFNQKKGVKAILRCCKGAGYNAPPRDPSKPHVVMQEITLNDCFVSSISTGGSGGEDRLTENITLTFRSLEFKINDTRAKDPLAPPEDPTKKKKQNRYGEEEEEEEEEKPAEDGAPAKPKYVSTFVPPTATVALDSLRKTVKLDKKEGYNAAPSSASSSSAVAAPAEESKMQD